MKSLQSICRSFLTFGARTGLWLAVLFLACVAGCSRSESPPPALTLEELPPALEKAFAKAKPEATERVNSLQAALREKDFPKALMTLQSVVALSGLNKQQANVAAAGLVTINNALQEAQSQGDQNAAQTLQTYHSTK